MKVFVCYRYISYEGRSEPLAAFSNQSSAEEWCKKEEKKGPWYASYDWEKLEVQE